MRWLRIMITDKKPATVEIGYQTAVSGGYTDHLVTSPEAPHPDFVNAMAAIAPAVITIAELKGVAEAEDITVRSVALGHKKAGRTSVIITALRALQHSSGPMLINTPLKYIVGDDAEDDGDGDEKLDKDLALKIDLLCGEARAFIEDGKRAQGDLFPKGETKKNGRRARAEDGFQAEQNEMEMGEGGSLEGSGESLEGSAELVAATPGEATEVEEVLSIAHAAPILDVPIQDGDLTAVFGGVSTRAASNGDETQTRKQAALAKVNSWLDYKEYCFTFGIKPTRAEFDSIVASRDPSEVRAGYRDPQLAKEREEARLAARAGSTPAHAGSNNDDDLLS